MKKSTRKNLNRILHQVFKVVKDKHKRAKIATRVSKLFVDKNNSVAYDESFNMYWQLYKGKCLQIHEKPIFDFSYDKYNERIDAMFCREYSVQPNDIIVDLGAGIGGELHFYDERMQSKGHIYAIEASPDSYHKLNKLVQKNQLQNVSTYNLAITATNGSVWIEETDAYKANQINSRQSGKEVPGLTLDDFVAKEGIKQIDLFKVNIEGAEEQIIKGMDASVNIIQNFAISCHDFLFEEETNIRETVKTYFQSKGFEVTEINTGNKYIDSWIYGKRMS